MPCMLQSRKKAVSSLIIALFVVFLALCSTHFHAKGQSSEKDTCSLCQASHGSQKQALSASKIKIAPPSSEGESLASPSILPASRFLLSSPCRGPPAFLS